MRLPIVLMALLVGSCAAPRPEQPMAASELAGRSSGTPQRCVSLSSADSLRRSDTDPHTLVFGSGRVIFENRLGQCAFGNDDVLVIERTSSYSCQGDLVHSFDRASHVPGPTCVLGDFIPYRR